MTSNPVDDPQAAVDQMAFGMSLEQRQQANLAKGKKVVHTWV